MSEQTAAWVMMGAGVAQVAVLLAALSTLRDAGLPKPPRRSRRGDRLLDFGFLGVLMTALDDALARVTTFVKDVVTQLKAAKSTNDTQTGKLAELQAALDTALSDDAADKAAIAALQSEIATLQESVAAQINAAVDALQNVPEPVVEAPVEEPVSDDLVVVEEPVAEVTEPVVDEVKDAPVE